MGESIKKKCPKCGYEINCSEGGGYLFPIVYDETVEKAKSGELGEKLQTFFKEHEEGMINAEDVTLCCEECGHIAVDQDLTMYIPSEIENDKDVDFDDEYWPMLIPRNYEVYSVYPHKCDKCGGNMRCVSMRSQLLCPKCRISLEDEMGIMWD